MHARASEPSSKTMKIAVAIGALLIAASLPATTLAQQNSSAPSATLPSTIPTGTRFLVRLDDEVSNQKHQVNKKIKAKTFDPLQTDVSTEPAPRHVIHGDIS